MKKIFFLYAASLALLSLSGCSDDIDYGVGEGEGRVLLHTQLKNDVAVKSRAGVTDDALAKEAVIWISNAEGPVRKYEGIDQVPAEGIWLASDNYVAEVWAGDSVPASFEQKQFKGIQPFVISAGKTVQVEVECTIANSVVEVHYADAVDGLLTDYAMTVGHKAGSLTWSGAEDDGKTGYFMMPSFDRNLTCTFTGTMDDGNVYKKERVIENPKPATKYIINVMSDTGDDESFGGGLFTITVDETEIEVEDVVEIVSAPVIEALDFDLAQPVTGKSGEMSEMKLWIKSSAPFESVEVSCPALGDMLEIGGYDWEIFSMQQSVVDQLAAKGFSFQHYTHTDDAENPDFEEVKLVFSDVFMNLLPDGEYAFTIKATDTNKRSTTAMFQVIVSNDALRTEQITDASTVWATHTVLHASIMKEGETGFGFNYREAGTQQWQTVNVDVANPVVGASFEAEITGLQPGTEYEYQAFCDSFTADTYSFTTESALQLPNAGFEDWTQPGKAWLPYLSENDMFWDSGNHGSTTMDVNVTTPTEEKLHSGKYSVRLESQFVGFGGFLGKFAAGNIFVGKYLATNGTNGVLGWGRPFASRPTSMKGYLHYTPASVTDVDSSAPESVKAEFVKGEPDKGIIYIAIVDDTKQSYNSEQWACVVNTNPSASNYFDKNGANVIAYGELVLSEATAGSDMVEFEIPLEYHRTDKQASNIIVVCSASKAGDYFTGGRGSLLYLDDLELVY